MRFLKLSTATVLIAAGTATNALACDWMKKNTTAQTPMPEKATVAQSKPAASMKLAKPQAKTAPVTATAAKPAETSVAVGPTSTNKTN